MPTYDYECQSCDLPFVIEMRMSEYDSKKKPPCPTCQSLDKIVRIFTPPMINFPGDGWATKNNRIAGQMRKKNERLDSKTRDLKGDGFVPQLTPNVNGEEVRSWGDAAKLAKDLGKDTSGYDTRARKEPK